MGQGSGDSREFVEAIAGTLAGRQRGGTVDRREHFEWLAAVQGKRVRDERHGADSERHDRTIAEWAESVRETPQARNESPWSARSSPSLAPHNADSLEWASLFSDRARDQLRDRRANETSTNSRDDPTTRLGGFPGLTEWDETDHPRHPKGTPVGGQFAPKGGGSAGGGAMRVGGDPSDPSHWYLPSDDKGKWVSGTKGEGVFRLKKPVEANGKLIYDIKFTKGVPIIHDFSPPEHIATIVLTGDHNIDRKHARMAWQRLNVGKEIPANMVFHHDLLSVSIETAVLDGKKVRVLVGKMQLIPKDLNAAVFHQGSASVAKKYYRALGIDVSAVARLAKSEALLGESGEIVSRGLRKIRPGKIPKRLQHLVGRSIVRAIPLVGTGLAVIEFADNVEAHGFGGAVVRATPLLGDVVSAYDFASELAQEIRDDAEAKAAAASDKEREIIRQTWNEADAQTIEAFDALAGEILVTNQPQSSGGGLVDPQEIADALHVYRSSMQSANLLSIYNVPGFDFKATKTRYYEELRTRLERASQRNAPASKLVPGLPVY